MTTGNRIRTYRDHAELREAAAKDDREVITEAQMVAMSLGAVRDLVAMQDPYAAADAVRAERADRWRRTAGLLPPAKR